LIPEAKSGLTFSTVSIDVPIYLNYLLTRFLAQGGRILRGSVLHINQVLEGGTGFFAGGSKLDPLPAAVIVCVGISARFLGGVEDKDVYPIRGQTVLIRAPWVRFGKTVTLDEVGNKTYIIPRRSSDVRLLSSSFCHHFHTSINDIGNRWRHSGDRRLVPSLKT
jgi:hypothetical protein